MPVAGKTAEVIARLLEPLDLIVWNGHVIIVLDRDMVIESRLECGRPGNGGVRATPLKQRLAEIMRTRRAADVWPKGSTQRDLFVVRRWFVQVAAPAIRGGAKIPPLPLPALLRYWQLEQAQHLDHVVPNLPE